MHLMVQPAIADILFRDRLLMDQGLLSRLLVTAPDSVAGTRLWREPDPASTIALNRYNARLLEILRARLPLKPGSTNELESRRLPLSSNARQLWIEFADHVERAMGPEGELEPIRGLANKLAEHAARLAGVLTLVRDLYASDVSVEELRAGIALAEHYAAEALRLFGTARISAELRLAKRLLDWLLNVWPEKNISLPDIYQRSLNAIGDKASAEKLVTILEDHGWLVRIPQGGVVAGQRRRDAWRIIRSL
jgi:hypothetical protein